MKIRSLPVNTKDMENKKIAVGLDIGTTKIVAMVGQKNEFDKVEILGIGKSQSLGVQKPKLNLVLPLVM